MNEKKIVLLAGAPGVGKTSLARELMCSEGFDHQIGVGFLREILRSVLSRERYPFLFTFSYKPEKGEEILQNFDKQCKLVSKSVNACIARARNEGTSLIIEGSNLLPGYINIENIDLFITLFHSNHDLHKKATMGKTHSRRIVDDIDFMNILIIQDYIIKKTEEMLQSKVKVLNNVNYNITKTSIIHILDSNNSDYNI